MNISHPLVTIGVATYNSSRYIVEALDSFYKQSYDNLELIISDDASKDDTVKIVNEWLDLKGARFIRTKVITVKENTGTSKNLNRIIKEATGDWIKFIAGDDVLLPKAIENNISFITKHDGINWLFTKAVFYNNIISEENIIIESKSSIFDKYSNLNSMDCKEQLEHNYIGNYFKAPTHFFRKALLVKVAGFDEDFGILEDYPMWLKLLSLGEKCYYFDEFTVGYRLSDTNVSIYMDKLVNKKMNDLTFNAQKKYVLNVCSRSYRVNIHLRYQINRLFSHSYLNKRTRVRLFAYRLLLRMADLLSFGHSYKLEIDKDA